MDKQIFYEKTELLIDLWGFLQTEREGQSCLHEERRQKEEEVVDIPYKSSSRIY